MIAVVPVSSYDGSKDEAASSAHAAIGSHSGSFFLRLSAPLVAMQFGQLLTHLDTTQQMINNTLKDNNTLLAQVGSPGNTAGSAARCDMITGGFLGGV